MTVNLQQVQYIVKVMKHNNLNEVKPSKVKFPQIKLIIIDEEDNVFVDVKDSGQVILPQLGLTV